MNKSSKKLLDSKKVIWKWYSIHFKTIYEPADEFAEEKESSEKEEGNKKTKPEKKSFDSKIITFYSYKGGVGRSMAMANVAYLLAERYHYKVLMIDWDLEAPGLHKYFDIGEDEIENGLIDLFYDYKKLLKQEVTSLEEEFINIDKYIVKLKEYNGGVLSILPSGRHDGKYANRVNDFEWDDFYKNWYGYGFIEYLKEQLKKRADIILIDSRTGVTDHGGICTLQMPDVVVILFTFNEQGAYGTQRIINNILEKSTTTIEQGTPPKLIIIPSRVERYLEQETKSKWEIKYAERFEKYLPEKGRENAIKYMKKKSIPYVGYYSFGERLATKDDPHGELSESLDNLTIMVMQESGFKLNEPSPTYQVTQTSAKSEKSGQSSLSWGITALILILMGFLEFIKFISGMLFKEKLNIIRYVDMIISYMGYLIIIAWIVYFAYYPARKIFMLIKDKKWRELKKV